MAGLSKTQISIAGLDRDVRKKFKRQCEDAGYSMNAVLKKLIVSLNERPELIKGVMEE